MEIRPTLSAVCAFPVLLLIIVVCMRATSPLFAKLQAEIDDMNAVMQEGVTGIRILKACVREIYEKAKFRKTNGKLIKTQLKVLVIFAFMNPLVNIVMYLAVVLILRAGAADAAAGTTTPGAIMAAITYTTQMLSAVMMLTMLFQNIVRGRASWKRVREVLDGKPDPVDGESEGESEITGEVLVDGRNVKDYKMHALRDKVRIALQKAELMSTTVDENIAWGKEDATEDEIRAAATVAQADGFVASTEAGYDTEVCERGARLSGGQKQRIAIARAVLRPCEILIFDDATGAVDLRTEADLYAALNAAYPDTTKIIVAQRVRSVRNADRIVVLDNGTVAGMGTHEQLLASCGVYRDICFSQSEGESHVAG